MQVTLCVDALEPNSGGIGRYTWELCKGLSARDDVATQYFARNRLIRAPAKLLAGEMPPRRLPGLRKLGGWWDGPALRKGLVHAPNYFLPPFADKGVITVHDLSAFRFPQTHPAERVRAFEQKFTGSIERANLIITDTETVRSELIEDFGVAPDKVTAIHLGVDSRFGPQEVEAIREQLAPYNLQPKGYGLCVSTLEPRKKITELLTAWRSLAVGLRTRYPLALAGGSGWLNESLREQIQRGAAEGWLRPLGFVAETDLPALYAGAALFIYPSTYEGFGLPPLEAMASGIPVIVASRSCLPEVCGEAAAYVDPDDSELLLATISRGLTDEAWQSAASQLGLERAAGFTWGRCVDRTVAAYRHATTLI